MSRAKEKLPPPTTATTVKRPELKTVAPQTTGLRSVAEESVAVAPTQKSQATEKKTENRAEQRTEPKTDKRRNQRTNSKSEKSRATEKSGRSEAARVTEKVSRTYAPNSHSGDSERIGTGLTSSSQILAGAKGEARAGADSDGEDESRNENLIPILLVAVLFIIGAALVMPSGHQAGGPSRRMTDAQMRDRVEYFKYLEGSTLNGARISTEYQNLQTAPELPESASRVKPPSTLDGLPLQGEANTRDRSTDLPSVVDPDQPDAQIHYSLQEEQDEQAWEKTADQAYLQDFVNRAAKDGYETKVVNGGLVLRRLPNWVPPQSPSSVSVQGPPRKGASQGAY